MCVCVFLVCVCLCIFLVCMCVFVCVCVQLREDSQRLVASSQPGEMVQGQVKGFVTRQFTKVKIKKGAGCFFLTHSISLCEMLYFCSFPLRRCFYLVGVFVVVKWWENCISKLATKRKKQTNPI